MKQAHIHVVVDNLKDGFRFDSHMPTESVVIFAIAGMK
jgi:hypothetical protein